MASSSPCEPLFLGIDGGGTKCKALLVDSEQRVLGEGEGGPANPYHGYERSCESIVNAADQALKAAGFAPQIKAKLNVGLGLAGLHLPSQLKKMQAWDHPFKRAVFTNDLHIACIAAHENDDGAVIVAGTGSCGFAHVNGKTLTLGAHGIPCGDKGSGAWLGLSAIQAVLLASDGLGPASSLQSLVEDRLQAKGLLIVDRLNGASSNEFAKLAPLVIHAAENNDSVALNIVRDGAEYLSQMALRLLELEPPRISMLGGISAVISQWMHPEVQAKLSPALKSAEYGAVHLVRAQLETLGAVITN